MGRPITVTVGGLASATATKVATSQKAAGAQHLVLNGAASDASANNISTSQSPSGAGNLTITGSLATSGVAYIGNARRVYVTSAGDDSGLTFTVYGFISTPIGQSFIQETVTGANTSVVSTVNLFNGVSRIAVSGASASTVTVGTNGVATLDKARQLLFTDGGNDTGTTFLVLGTDVNNNAQSESVTGTSGSTVATVLSYKTVTGILTSAAVATTITVGTNGVSSSPWVNFDDYSSTAPTSIQCTASGTVNYTVQQTMDDPNSASNPVAPSAVTWVNHPDTALVAASSTVQGNYAYTPIWARVVLNSGTGTVTATFRQVGNW